METSEIEVHTPMGGFRILKKLETEIKPCTHKIITKKVSFWRRKRFLMHITDAGKVTFHEI